jgi:Uma2 family endonuclease
MTLATVPSASPPANGSLYYPLTVQQYHKMIEVGILRKGDRVELLEGWLVKKVTQNPPHNSSVTRVNYCLAPLVPATWHLRIQAAITLGDSEPEPDVLLVMASYDQFDDHHPGPDDVGLVVEIADTTLSQDQNVKTRIYARARLPVYWIVNLPARRVEVYTQPRGGKTPRYRQCQTYDESASVPVVVGTATLGSIPVRNLLPAAH